VRSVENVAKGGHRPRSGERRGGAGAVPGAQVEFNVRRMREEVGNGVGRSLAASVMSFRDCEVLARRKLIESSILRPRCVSRR
jgi:hypothetical protein